MQKLVVWFKEVDKHDLALVGGKGANLGEMTKIGIPVPNGFIVTSEAYYQFVEENQLKTKLESILSGLDVSASQKLEAAAKKAQQLVSASPIPKEISREIISRYLKLGHLFHDPYVAVRSSATAEDLPTASFAGQQATFLNVRGEASVVHYVRECWASLFTARAIFYRVENKFDHFQVGIAVPVQKMVQSERSGIMFTVNPVTGSKTSVVIEAIYGLGELIVQGAVTPDHFEVDKKTLAVVYRQINDQDRQMRLKKGKTVVEKLAEKERRLQKISDAQVVALANFGKKLELHYYFPQDIEWAIEKNQIFITQTRPITTIKSTREMTKMTDRHEIKHTRITILQGDPASPGVASGPVKIVASAREIDKVSSGDVLVAPQTNPDYVPAMRKVAAIITETGGRTSHAAIVSRELGIPAVVGATGATKKLVPGQVVTVHGSRGVVYKGGFYKSEMTSLADHDSQSKSLTPGLPQNFHNLKTATKVFVNLAEPERAYEIAKKNIDGVGLLRAEFMIAGIGKHPKRFIKEKRQHVFIDELSRKLAVFCEAFQHRPVVYRATDFRTNEYRNLVGGVEYEPEEANPMLGFRGAFRYISDPAVFMLELAAIRHVRNKLGFKNLWLMIPFVHTPKEFAEVKKIVATEGLLRSPSFKLWMMVEIPSNVILLEDFIDQGIDGVSIGSNDLTMLILGVDRDNSEVAGVFNEQDPAVLWALERVIKTCHARHITASICGQAPSDYPDLVERLVSWGITSISVNQDVIDQVRETIYQAEQRLATRPSKR